MARTTTTAALLALVVIAARAHVCHVDTGGETQTAVSCHSDVESFHVEGTPLHHHRRRRAQEAWPEPAISAAGARGGRPAPESSAGCCDDGSDPGQYCLDADACYTVDPGADCGSGGGPTDAICGDTCEPCGGGGGGDDDGSESDEGHDDDHLNNDGIGADDNMFDDELVDETCPSLAEAGEMSSAGDGLSCSPASCMIVDNPDCDDVTFEHPMNDMTQCTDDPEHLIYDLFEAEVFENSRSDCAAATGAGHPLCANLTAFLAPLPHAFVGAYCTDEYLVLWAHGLYRKGTAMCDKYRDHLQAVPRPPGIDYKQTGNQANKDAKTKSSTDNNNNNNNNKKNSENNKNDKNAGKEAFLGDGGYDDQCVGRSARPQLDVYKIPLAAAAAVPVPETWGPDFFPASAVGAMLDGLAHYPALDASGLTVWDSCESTLCNAHVGMGFDLHHHGNPGPSEQCLYDNATDSVFYGTLDAEKSRVRRRGVDGNDPHGYPVGIAADGYFMYGQYAEHAAAEPALDLCGGHSHAVNGTNEWDPNEYHYHAYTTRGSDGMYSFWQGPSNCWKGDVGTIPNFYEDPATFKLNYDSSKTCSIADRSDYQQLRACADSHETMYYEGSGAVQPCNWFGDADDDDLATAAT